MGNRGIAYLAAAVVLGVAGMPSARADAFRDEKLGYSFNTPAKWPQVPVDAGGWLVAQFNSKQEYEWADGRNNFWTRHRPYLRVVVIPASAKDTKGATVEKTAEGVKIRRAIPWKNLKEYLDETSKGIGGFHFSAEDEATVNGLTVHRYEVTVDKNVQGERRIYGWEFVTEDALYGLVAEILVQEEKKLKPDLFASFSSFRTFPRTGKLPAATLDEDEIKIRDPKKEVSEEDLKKNRQDAVARALARIKENLPAGWTISESKNFTAVSHSDAKFTREILGQAEAVRAWLESTLGFVGSGYAGRMIIRICANNQEYDSLQRSRGWSWDAPELITYKDRDGWSNWSLRGVNRGLYDIWLRDKNERLRWGLPRWISWGLGDFVERARLNSGRLEFKADTWDSVEMKQMRRSDSLLKPRDFFTLTSDELGGGQGNSTQIQFFVNFLLEGAASRSPKFRSVLSDYMKNLIFLLDTERDPAPGDAKEPQNEQEEAEMVRKRMESWRQRERQTLDTLLEKTFPGWTAADWDSFNALYRQDLK